MTQIINKAGIVNKAVRDIEAGTIATNNDYTFISSQTAELELSNNAEVGREFQVVVLDGHTITVSQNSTIIATLTKGIYIIKGISPTEYAVQEPATNSGGGTGPELEVFARFPILNSNPSFFEMDEPNDVMYYGVPNNIQGFDMNTGALISDFPIPTTTINDMFIGSTSDYICANQNIHLYDRFTGVLGPAAGGGTGLRTCIEHRGHIYTSFNNTLQKRGLDLVPISTIPVTGSNCFNIVAEGDDIVFSYSSGNTFVVDEPTFTLRGSLNASNQAYLTSTNIIYNNSFQLFVTDRVTLTETILVSGLSNFICYLIDENGLIYMNTNTVRFVLDPITLKFFGLPSHAINIGSGLRRSKKAGKNGYIFYSAFSAPAQSIIRAKIVQL